MTSRPCANVVLIGMPGAGKSTVGRALARRLGWAFLDTDALLEQRHGAPLQQLLEQWGTDGFLRLEEEALLSLGCHHTVIATGGSAVYSHAGMDRLRQLGAIVWLDADLATLGRRIRNSDQRGLVRQPGQSLAELLTERHELYARWADLHLPNNDGRADAVAGEIFRHLENFLLLPRNIR